MEGWHKHSLWYGHVGWIVGKHRCRVWGEGGKTGVRGGGRTWMVSKDRCGGGRGFYVVDTDLCRIWGWRACRQV